MADASLSPSPARPSTREVGQWRQPFTLVPNVFILIEVFLGAVVLVASASLNCRWREDEEADTDADVGPGLLPVALAASSSPVGGIILVGFVEVGAVVVAAVRLAAVAMAESDVPEHLIFSFCSGFSYLSASVLRVAGAVRPPQRRRRPEHAVVTAEGALRSLSVGGGDSWPLGVLEAATATVAFTEFVLRMAKGGGEVLPQPDKTLFGMPTLLLVLETAMSGTVFLLFLLFGTPDSVSPLRSDKGRPEAGPERRRRRPDPADYRCHRLGYAAIVSPFFLYVDSVLLVSIAWADKDNIMTSAFSFLSGLAYLVAGSVYLRTERRLRRSPDRGCDCPVLGLLSVTAGLCYLGCGVVFALYYRGAALYELLTGWDLPLD